MAEMAHAAFTRLLAIVQSGDVANIPVGGGRYALVDKADEAVVAAHTWTSTDRYALATIDGRKVPMHRLIIGPPDNAFVDHEDGDGFNNQRHNLRICSHAENMRNRTKVGGKSRFKGVYATSRRWRAEIRADGKKHSLGTYATEREAAAAYDKAAKELHGAFAKTNADLCLY